MTIRANASVDDFGAELHAVGGLFQAVPFGLVELVKRSRDPVETPVRLASVSHADLVAGVGWGFDLPERALATEPGMSRGPPEVRGKFE